MKPWTVVDRLVSADGKVVSLHAHDKTWVIQVDGVPLMSTRQHASEEKAATMACEHLLTTRGARVLIGGLGFGFTAKAALSVLPRDATLTVAEIFPEVIAWNRNPALKIAADTMADTRLSVVQQDVADVIAGSSGVFDSIILDVDNGPAALSADRNHELYSDSGLRQTRAALRPAGVAAYWSAFPSPEFERRMTRAGFSVTSHQVRARGNSGSRHTIFLGRTE